MINVLQVTPFLHVPDIEAAILFFTQTLGFELTFRMDTYAYVELEQRVGIRLMEESARTPVKSADARLSIYIDVKDVDLLYSGLEHALKQLPTEDVQPPVTKPWNQRELWVKAPDGNWLVFGHFLEQAVNPVK